MSTPDFTGLSIQLVQDVTLYRNQSNSSKSLVRVGYTSTAVIAAVESVAALAFCAFSLSLYPLSPVPLERSATWLHSNMWAIVWSGINIVDS